ncbi:hypothetical protein F2Q70_00005891 [Brassica cretica]|uniref:DUF4283 domain-containing protein n=1 Tax=Brassica cretica TaxID=69181 RepID=A0A8S9IS26_BRACR|nr:hypothetical protein F2Q70_00005891 [Brassica cretica]
MQSPWRVPGSVSDKSPPSSAADESPPPIPTPPDPPDHSSPLSPYQFPPFSASSPSSKLKLSTVQTLKIKGILALQPPTPVSQLVDVTMASQDESENLTTGPEEGSETLSSSFIGPGSSTEAPIDTFTASNSQLPPQPYFATEKNSVLKPSNSSPPLPQKASVPPAQNPNPILLPHHKSSSTNSQTQQAPVLLTPTFNPLPSHNQTRSFNPNPSLVERLRLTEDKSLKRLAPITIAETGRPRILIPDHVFEKGAEIHKDFIVCYYNGRPPPFNQIQSVLNHMWGKRKRLEIHNNPINRSTLVRIPSEYLRQKILEKCIWYIGDSMFHTAQWSSEHSMSTPPLKAIRIWAHLIGVPLDLRYQQGLSLVAGLVGEPKETDDFTKNLVSLTVSHVKVEVDLTKPLPDVVEFQRQSGEVVEVQVHYPWTPPICSHCNELEHSILST